MEYWGNGVMGKYEKNSQFDQTNQYSNTPLLCSFFFCAIDRIALPYHKCVNPISLLPFLFQTFHQLQ
jgi:hypothetical protein